MKVENLVELHVGDEVAVLGLVGHVDDVLPLQGDLVAFRIENLGPMI
jgi:hypothetical protein